MKIVVFGLSITSAWGNGHATTFRALLKALHERKHDIVFFEKETEWYAHNRDLPEPPYCRLILYDNWSDVSSKARKELADADVGMVGSYFPDGVVAIDELLDSRAGAKTFYDIDTLITIANLGQKGSTDYVTAAQLSGFDIYFSFTGGPMLREIEEKFGAKSAFPLYCSFDPCEYHRFPANKRFACDLSYMGTYAPDRQAKLEELLVRAATDSPESSFTVAGSQYPKRIRWPKNVRRITHLNPKWHARFYSSSPSCAPTLPSFSASKQKLHPVKQHVVCPTVQPKESNESCCSRSSVHSSSPKTIWRNGALRRLSRAESKSARNRCGFIRNRGFNCQGGGPLSLSEIRMASRRRDLLKLERRESHLLGSRRCDARLRHPSSEQRAGVGGYPFCERSSRVHGASSPAESSE